MEVHQGMTICQSLLSPLDCLPRRSQTLRRRLCLGGRPISFDLGNEPCDLSSMSFCFPALGSHLVEAHLEARLIDLKWKYGFHRAGNAVHTGDVDVLPQRIVK